MYTAKPSAEHPFREEAAGKANVHRVELTRLDMFFPQLRHEFSAAAVLADKHFPDVSDIDDVTGKIVSLDDVCREDEVGAKELAPRVLQKMPFVRHSSGITGCGTDTENPSRVARIPL